MSRWIVVLAGGVGSRFWPLSTPSRPKQLLPLVGSRAMLVDAVERLQPIADATHTLILTNASLVESISELLPGVPHENIIAEPKPSGTAAALAWAANLIQQRDGEDAVMISVHADWAVADEDGFRKVLLRGAEVALQKRGLVTVGIVPARPDPGFGYIQPGDEVEPGVYAVARFIEKPDVARAREMVREGYLWNSGIFIWRAGDFLGEVRALTPEISPALDAHPSDIDAFFGAVQPITVDVGVMERSRRVMVLPGDFGWDDVGTWGALGRVKSTDSQENALTGEVHAVKAHRNVVHAEADGTTVVLYGVDDLVVVAREGLVLVTTVALSAELKSLMESLPPEVREQA